MTITEKIENIKRYVEKCEPYRAEWALRPWMQIEQHSISLGFTVYRWLQCVAHHVIVLGTILELYTGTVQTHSGSFYAKWPLYLTSWVVVGNMVQSLLGTIAVTQGYRQYKGGTSGVPDHNIVFGVSKKFIEIYTIMYCVALNFSIFMVFGYWELMGSLPKGNENRIMVACYGLSSFLMLVDLFVVKFSYKMITGLYSLVVMAVYLMVTWLHFFTGSMDTDKHHYIYPGLDWSKPVMAVDHAMSSVFILEVINCFVLWWFFQLRRYIRKKYHNRQHSRESRQLTPPPQPPQHETGDQQSHT